MRTDEPMTTLASLAKRKGWTLVNWEAAHEEACDAVENQRAVYSQVVDPEDDRANEQWRKWVGDAVTNVWEEGLSHDAWTDRAIRRLAR